MLVLMTYEQHTRDISEVAHIQRQLDPDTQRPRASMSQQPVQGTS